jgi:Fe-S-cluster containining protein
MMNVPFEIERLEAPMLTVFIQRLKRIYAAMDDAYDRAAKRYGFSCDGCRDNCCRTRFYHHTFIEYTYLKQGLMALDAEVQDQIKLRAITVLDTVEKARDNREAVRLMCPLNVDTRCILYPYRPMICRLHGIPYELRKPGQPGIMGPGCSTFDRRCGHKPYISFDRTPLYLDMAKLEQAVRKATRFRGKIKMTVSEMILDFHYEVYRYR